MPLFNQGSKVRGNSQAAWLRIQEVQGLHQLQADQVYQVGPEGWREDVVSLQVQGKNGNEMCFFFKVHVQWPIVSQDCLCTDLTLVSRQTDISSDKVKHSPSHQGRQQSQEVQKSQGGR